MVSALPHSVAPGGGHGDAGAVSSVMKRFAVSSSLLAFSKTRWFRPALKGAIRRAVTFRQTCCGAYLNERAPRRFIDFLASTLDFFCFRTADEYPHHREGHPRLRRI